MSHTVAPSGTDLAGDVVADFAAAARDWPDRAAIVHNGTTIDYRDLAARVRVTASRYQGRGIGADGASGLIGVLVSHTPDVVDHLLGILQAGAAYCPIDVALPVARKQTLATVLGLDRLFVTAGSSHQPMNLRIETLDEHAVPPKTELPQPSWHPSDPAYVLCTSGSTGVPKPVVVSRRALTITVRALRHLFALTPDDRVLQFASLGWDTCLEEILPALTAGATLVFDDAAHSASFPIFVRMLAEREVTVLDLPTAFWHELVLFLHEEQAALPDSVRLVVIGGERVDRTRLRQWRDLDVGQVRLLNTYGCTETTMVTHAVQLSGPGTEAEVATRDAEAPLGRPLAHLRDHVTDEGELLVSGPSLATGYLGLPELTATGFPIVDLGSGPTRWFHTGDIVTRGEGGLLYARGRTDEQVKVLGVRVHPGEVEAQLTTHPAVAGAVVVGERRLGRTVLTAYVVPVGAITAAELKRYLRERLPGQFVPSRVEFVDGLAYTASGKVDRTATRLAAADHGNKGVGR
ncbi:MULTISPECIES: AMP-binding protein [unclassified Mycolicibacterium]|uniref:AMP-binding protein n=1 Tax=unclassified Mycolicibacterium TaxID=2636767 RepID=UPI0012DCEA0D|nr:MULTISPECIES: AMP-binding protein [unclassified Mycolicibacterium]MUL84000.1 amino acid adenylation domain-containing protein [Mycolicibacterium sp. CBMA 329]MUL89934.1 amino acid adenylation domain-containing protein [Mycolicibacterium sp. CBMA 331]MUL98045.1 amino acid adenylation domain-containing protein [Mycolicibacterium sp. CBMA 334]MUM30030.1 amino acid adenylation domain-containing protein [Mycolicibacterium sp. CBMA 295]MUM39449.1 amino acid adenylation domain-containing protein [